MPLMSEATATVVPTHALILGDTKAGKTDYVMKAAEAGFNVLYIDGDVAAPTLAKLSPEAKRRLFYMPVHDTVDSNGAYQPKFAEFLVAFTTQGRFLWNDSLCQPFSIRDYVAGEGGHEVWEIRPSRMDTSVVFVLDSWTRLSHSLVSWKAEDQQFDLMEADKYGRELYQGAGLKASQMLKLLAGLKCHLAVIGHPREYIKRSVPKGTKGTVPEKEMKIDWIQMVPVSTSNPHALTMGANFSDIGWIDVNAAGRRTIDFRPSDSRMIGGTNPVHGSVDELTMGKMLSQNGQYPAPAPNPHDAWLTRWPNGTYEPAVAKSKPILTGAKPTQAPSTLNAAQDSPPAVIKGLGALAGLKPSGVTKL